MKHVKQEIILLYMKNLNNHNPYKEETNHEKNGS